MAIHVPSPGAFTIAFLPLEYGSYALDRRGYRFRAKLAQIVALAEAGDIPALQAFEINPISSSPKAMARYRDLCVIAINARAQVPA